MSMTGAGLTSAVVAALEAANPTMTAAQKSQLQASMSPICTAIVTYIQSNATVEAEATGVQSGGATAPVTGTII